MADLASVLVFGLIELRGSSRPPLDAKYRQSRRRAHVHDRQARASGSEENDGVPLPDPPVGLSKSRALRGLQCHKLLWWTIHEPAAPELEIDPQRRAVLDQGRLVGAAAR